MVSTKLKTLHDIAIYVSEDGKFTAELGRTLVQRSRLVDLEKLIEQAVRGVECLVLRDHEISMPEFAVIVGAESDGRFRDRDRRIFTRWGPKLYLKDDVALAHLQQIEREHQVLYKRWSDVVDGLTRLAPEHLASAPADFPSE